MLIFMIVFGILYFVASKYFGKINFEEIDKDQISINENLYEEVSEDITKQEFDSIRNIVLFGIDGGRSDAIIIVSLNQTKHTLKLISIPRDTYVYVEGYGKTKINHAYAYGKEQLAVQTINSNFRLDITEYATVNFTGLIHIINALGGIDIEITKEEKNYINQYSGEEYSFTKKSKQIVSNYGLVTLTGEQALTHARNRTIGNDFDRAERQRNVITAMINKISNLGVSGIMDISDTILAQLKTNIDVTEWIGILTGALSYINEYKANLLSVQIPTGEVGNGSAKGQTIDGIYYFVCDIDETAESFKNTIYGESNLEE